MLAENLVFLLPRPQEAAAAVLQERLLIILCVNRLCGNTQKKQNTHTENENTSYLLKRGHMNVVVKSRRIRGNN